jgi:hypothetical protein
MPPSTSPAFSLNSIDLFKGLRGALLTHAAGLLIQIFTDLSAYLNACAQHLPSCQLHVGPYEFLFPGAIALVGFVLEMLRRYVTDHSK